VAAKSHCCDKVQTQILSQIAQYLVDESDFKFAKTHLLNYLSCNNRQLRNLLNASSKLQGRVMIDLKQAYQQSDCHEAAIQTL
jgi:hypothetical protein